LGLVFRLLKPMSIYRFRLGEDADPA
jgi:hypothetical protein